MNINLNQLIIGSIIGVIIGIGLFISVEPIITSNEETIKTITSTTTTTTYITTTSSNIVPINTITNTVTTTKISNVNVTTTVKNTVINTVISSTTRTDTTTVTTTLIIADSQTLSVQSSSFNEGDVIPTQYTCDGLNISPPLLWIYPPEGTESFVIIMDDPDAPTGVFTHWILFNLPRDIVELPEGLPPQEVLENGGVHGVNGIGQLGYFGPCPLLGPSHTYRFHLYALDIILSLESGASKQDVLQAIEGHILSETELTGEYER
jgi:Raf kinase inhibitor-like YbhB/YbcL family protein